MDLRKLTLKFIYNLPYFAESWLELRKVASNSVTPTMGVSAHHGDFVLYYNEDYVSQLSLNDYGVLGHEMLHIALNHFERLKERDRALWNIATDLAINQLLPKESLPGGLFPDMFNLPKKQDAETYYQLLSKNAKKIVFSISGGNGKGNNGNEKKGDDAIKEAQKHLADDHGNWKEIEKLPDSFVKTMAKYYANKIKSCGDCPGALSEIFNKLYRKRYTWIKKIKDFTGNSVKSLNKYTTWAKFNRKCEMLRGVRREYSAPVLVLMDVSGSIGEKELADSLNAMFNILAQRKLPLVILFHDIEVCNEMVVTSPKQLEQIKTNRGGGTDFVKPFHYVQEHYPHIKRLIWFTDLYADYPKDTADYKILWIVTKDHNNKLPPTGEVVEIDNE